jgi:hypothetical protein
MLKIVPAIHDPEDGRICKVGIVGRICHVRGSYGKDPWHFAGILVISNRRPGKDANVGIEFIVYLGAVL